MSTQNDVLRQTYDARRILDALVEMIAERVAARLMDSTPAGTMLTVKEAAQVIRRSPYAVQQLVAKGSLPAVRADRRIHILRRDLDDWIERNRVA